MEEAASGKGEPLRAARDAAWTAHAGRAKTAAIGGSVQQIGRSSGRLGEEPGGLGETPLTLGQRSRRLGHSPLALGRRRPEAGETPLRFGETLSRFGERRLMQPDAELRGSGCGFPRLSEDGVSFAQGVVYTRVSGSALLVRLWISPSGGGGVGLPRPGIDARAFPTVPPSP